MTAAQVCYAVLAAAVTFVAYTYAGYPLLLRIFAGRRRGPAGRSEAPTSWPSITILLPVYNEEETLRTALSRILALDYPAARRQVLVVSDASTDRTNQIATEFAGRGVELVCLPERGGKTAAENYACGFLRGDVVVTIDASTVVPPASLKRLVAAFDDPSVGVASGRDVSIPRAGGIPRDGESVYTRYDMWVRDLETRTYGIVGASGCFYAQRTDLYRRQVPVHLSRDFASALVAREHGYRAISVDDAICHVVQSSSARAEYHRKVRTAARGIRTLWHQRHLLNPVRFGAFAWMLASHKLCRWMAPLALLTAGLAWLALSLLEPWALMATLIVVGIGLVAVLNRSVSALRRLRAIVGYGFAAMLASLHSWWMVCRGLGPRWWEPTRRASF